MEGNSGCDDLSSSTSIVIGTGKAVGVVVIMLLLENDGESSSTSTITTVVGIVAAAGGVIQTHARDFLVAEFNHAFCFGEG